MFTVCDHWNLCINSYNAFIIIHTQQFSVKSNCLQIQSPFEKFEIETLADVVSMETVEDIVNCYYYTSIRKCSKNDFSSLISWNEKSGIVNV